jgi:diguanylate cyclase (GGDEF)-like protein/PAS domain S-box-containing protein
MSEAIRVLLVEDELIDQLAFSRFIQREGLPYDAIIVSSVQEARSTLSEQKFDVIITDYHLGVDTALDLLEEIQDTPFIVITGLGDEEIAVKAMKLGASDYLTKDMQGNYLKTLPPVVTNAIKLKKAEIELIQYREGLEKMVAERTEELTLANQKLQQEIAERRQAEDALLASEEHYRTFFEDFPIGVYRVTPGPTGKLVIANTAYMKMFGYSSLQELIQQINVSDLYMNPAERKDFSDMLLAKGHVERFEMHLKRSDGKPIWGSVTASVVHDKNGKVYFDCAIEDVTERKRAEAQILLQTTALESAVNGIMIIDKSGRIVWANSSLMDMTGYSLDDLIGKSPPFIQGISPEENEYENLWNAIRLGLRWHGEVSTTRKDGVDFIAEMTLTPVNNDLGQVTHFISICNDISEKIQAREKLEYLATHDVLTELPNRLLFSDRLAHALAMANRSGGQGAILLIDLDDFKAINDAFSHDDGDEFLKLLARRFKDCLRESDTVSRIGGDEFAILLENISQDDVGLVARKINQILSEPVVIKENTIISTASIGISIFPQDGDEIQSLLRNADLAMYQAKEDKNTFRFYSHEMATRVEKQMELSTYLRYALQNEIFQLYYQPQVDAKTCKVIGIEALLRLPHPEREWIFPSEFIPLAEKTGLITSIDEWVLQTAGKNMRELVNAGFNEIKMSVNLSNRQLLQSDLASILDTVLKENNLDPGLLELEISESSVVKNVDKAITTLFQLKGMGLRLAIDDFGTGYASLNYLAHFPLDTLKIDLSFTRKVPVSKSDVAIVTGVITIANSLGLNVIVEGVEQKEQLEFFLDLGCRIVQGYFYSPPVPFSVLPQLLSDGFPLSA